MNTDSNSLLETTNRLYSTIGRVIVNFQFVEYVVAEHLALMLRMTEEKDVHRVLAAMSYRQKVDLMHDLYPSRRNDSLPAVDLATVRQALYVAEEFRNAIVHSFWLIEGAGTSEWMRYKSSLRSSAGLKITFGQINLDVTERGADALLVVRDWYVRSVVEIKDATDFLRAVIQVIVREAGT